MVPDVLVVASQFNLNDLSDRARRWVATHFRRVWETQTFGTLPAAMLEECVKAVIDQMVCNKYWSTDQYLKPGQIAASVVIRVKHSSSVTGNCLIDCSCHMSLLFSKSIRKKRT